MRKSCARSGVRCDDTEVHFNSSLVVRYMVTTPGIKTGMMSVHHAIRAGAQVGCILWDAVETRRANAQSVISRSALLINTWPSAGIFLRGFAQTGLSAARERYGTKVRLIWR